MARPSWFTPQLRRRAAWAVAASLGLPWLAGDFAKGFYTPGLAPAPEHSRMLIDFIVIGTMLFALTMVVTWLIGCWVMAVMKGPRIDGDAFPGAMGEPPK